MDLKKIDQKIQSEFARKRISAEQVASRNLARANAFPAYYELDGLEREIIFNLAKEKAKDKPNKSEVKGLTEALEKAQNEKSKILEKLGLTLTDLEPKFECKICSDVGFANGEMCNCYKKRRNEEIIKASGLMTSLDETFEKFDKKVFKNEAQANQTEALKNKLAEWVNKFPEIKKQNIVLCGQTGVGKTYLSKCMANALIAKKVSICYVSSFEMNDMFLKYHTTFDGSKSSVLSPLTECEVLFIDDLGAEPTLNNVTINYLYLILSERERFGRSTFITTNLLPENLMDRYGERIYSRLYNKRTSACFKLDGDDLRIK